MSLDVSCQALHIFNLFSIRFKEIVFPVEDQLKINSFDMPVDIQHDGEYPPFLMVWFWRQALITRYRRESPYNQSRIKCNSPMLVWSNIYLYFITPLLEDDLTGSQISIQLWPSLTMDMLLTPLQLIRRYDLWATNALANTPTETEKVIMPRFCQKERREKTLLTLTSVILLLESTGCQHSVTTIHSNR